MWIYLLAGPIHRLLNTLNVINDLLLPDSVAKTMLYDIYYDYEVFMDDDHAAYGRQTICIFVHAIFKRRILDLIL